jgi:threonine dehydrogenase-like Zn-dependent dehydrogenase
VRNDLSLICGSDLHLLFAEADPRIALASLPSTKRVYLGHEICGRVTEIGEAVKSVSVGDRVALRYPIPSCATEHLEPPCPRCAEGDLLLCENQASGLRTVPVGGGWGDQLVADETQVYHPPDALSDDAVALLEPAAVGLHAVTRALPAIGRRVLVLGCGIIGLMTLQALRVLSPESKVTAIARHRFQADMARELGDCGIELGGDACAITKQNTGARLYQGGFGSRMLLGGFDTVFDCVGTSDTLTESLRCVRAGGTVVAVGIQYKLYRTDLTPLYYQEIHLLGTWGYGREHWQGDTLDTFELAAGLMDRGDLRVDGLITHRFPQREWRRAVVVATDKGRSHSIKVGLTA